MPKISDTNYFLPDVQATEAVHTLSSGRTKPILMRGVCTQDGSKGDWVVKLKGSPEMFPDACMNEVLGSFIASEIVAGLAIPDKIKTQLYELFAFDLLIGNADRRIDKPNFLSNGEDILS